jgi:hypothetical protein
MDLVVIRNNKYRHVIWRMHSNVSANQINKLESSQSLDSHI